MTNHYLSREIVHAWSEEIGADMERRGLVAPLAQEPASPLSLHRRERGSTRAVVWRRVHVPDGRDRRAL